MDGNYTNFFTLLITHFFFFFFFFCRLWWICKVTRLTVASPVAQQDKPIGESKGKPWFWSCSSNMLNICPFCKSKYNDSIKYQTESQKWLFWNAQTNRTVWDHPSVTPLQNTQSEYVCLSQRKETNPSAESHDLSTQSTVSNALWQDSSGWQKLHTHFTLISSVLQCCHH